MLKILLLFIPITFLCNAQEGKRDLKLEFGKSESPDHKYFIKTHCCDNHQPNHKMLLCKENYCDTIIQDCGIPTSGNDIPTVKFFWLDNSHFIYAHTIIKNAEEVRKNWREKPDKQFNTTLKKVNIKNKSIEEIATFDFVVPYSTVYADVHFISIENNILKFATSVGLMKTPYYIDLSKNEILKTEK
jgi:hypothetical protein